MDKFILNALSRNEQNDIVVKIDGEAAGILAELVSKTGKNRKTIVSEMIKFCYPRTVIRRVTMNFKDMEENAYALEEDVQS